MHIFTYRFTDNLKNGVILTGKGGMHKLKLFPEEEYKRNLYFCFYLLFALLFAYIFIKYVLRLILPFLISFGIVMSLRPVINTVNKKTKISKKLISIVFVFIISALIALFVFFVFERILSEIRSLAEYLTENSEEIADRFTLFFKNIGEKIPVINKFSDNTAGEYTLSLVLKTLESKLGEIAAALPDKIYKFASSLPEVLLFSAVLIMSAVYACTDYDKISEELGKRLPKKCVAFWRELKMRLKNTVFKYLKASLLLIFITFSELLCGFLILGIGYAFLFAAIISLIDFLPVLGVGTVLLPWAAILLISGNYYLGTGLIIIYGVITIVRQLIEPHIMGKSMGVHPLLMLMAMYIGYGLFGVCGLILMPILSIIIYESLKPKSVQQTKP